MTKLAILTAAMLVGSSAVAHAASTCEVNPTTPVYAPDDSAISIIFDSFFAEAGNPANCNVSISSKADGTNNPDEFRVYRADYVGFVDAGETARFRVKHDGTTEEADVEGPKDVGDEYYSHFIGKDENGNITSRMRLTQDEGFGTTIDTLDYSLQGTMTRDQAEASLAGLGRAQTAMVTHLDATSGLLTGGNMTLTGDNEVRVLGGVGSFMLGGNVRYNISDGFSVLGGASIIDQGAGGAHYTGGMGALALRFVEPGGFFGEVGADGGIYRMRFSRTYTDSTGTQTVTGLGTGGIGALYVRGGVVFELDQSNEVVLSATAKQSFVGFGDYRETTSNSNLFSADLAGQTAGFTTVKLGADWTTSLTADVDLTAHVGLGTTMANQRTSAYILGGGTTTGGYASTVFAEYGLSLGWEVAPGSTVEGFVQGSTGTGIGTHAQIGAAYRMKF
ncbi:MAG: hypothetical protein JNL14_06605 [Devosia sp.]|uniref:hypothetical protein n=1 Tax=Devosia sp. TaxID=1871048 RepID=UPI001A3D1FFB|nr:hypothetical protein [Devosia sp.]MBL8597391.1 hypothetical protein [Devosia sp.]